MPLNTTVQQVKQKSARILEQKKRQKNVAYRLNEEVTYYAKGEEPRVGVITNMTQWKGDKIFEVSFEGEAKSRWGSDRQIKRTPAAWEIINIELEELDKAEKAPKRR